MFVPARGVLGAVLGFATACTVTTSTSGPTKVDGPFLTKPTVAAPAKPDAIAHDTPEFFVVWEADLKKGDAVTGTLIAVDTDGAAPANHPVVTRTYTSEVDTHYAGNFSFSEPDAGWPAGTYRVEIAGTKPLGSVAFAIK
ncbi:MAG: hypothetical protein NT062_07940 [Proteobacteria bacterium]|nr:hypothetical protein [Pseudomonadota bacterium]